MYSVLLVDDEPFIVEGLEILIDWKKIGLEIVGKCMNGLDALTFMKNNQVDILITDIIMPKMLGTDLIAEVKKLDSHCKFIILSGHDDFEYVKRGVQLGIENYLTKPVNTEELTSTLKDIVKNMNINSLKVPENLDGKEWTIIRNNILSRWVTDTISSDELLNRSSMLNLILDSHKYSVAIISISLDKEQFISIEDVHRLCNTQIIHDSTIMSFNDIDGNFVLIFSKENPTYVDNVIYPLLTKLKSNLASLNVHIQIALGPEVSSYKTVSLSYRKAIQILNHYLVFPTSIVLRSEDIELQTDNIDFSLSIDHDLITQSLLIQSKQQLHDHIHQITQKLITNDIVKRQLLRNVVIEIYMNLYKSIGTWFESVQNIIITDHSTLLQLADSVNDITSFEVKILESMDRIYDSMERKDSETNPVIKQVIDYIHKNYQNELSLKTLSYEFHMNATYLGQLFKKDTQTTFPNYLNQYRVEKAKELLLDSRIRVSQIAKEVGYIDPNYFYRTFKKYVGITPSDFKQLNEL